MLKSVKKKIPEAYASSIKRDLILIAISFVGVVLFILKLIIG